MKMIIFLIMIICITDLSYAWDSTEAKYFPLQVGNSWTYIGQGTFPGPCWTREKHSIIGTTVLNSHLYFVIQYRGINSQNNYYVRIDSSSMNVLQYTSNGGCPWSPFDYLKDSLKTKILDSFKVNCTEWWKTNDTTWQTVFGINRPTKISGWSDGFEVSHARYLSKDFGRIKWADCAGAAGCCTKTLIGCVINGTIYGDTSLTGIEPLSNEIPSEYKLYQNYPNPFNPTTKLRFAVKSEKSNVKSKIQLLIYNSLGQKVEILVNDKLGPGIYEVEWDGTDYPSGVYFYKLTAGEASPALSIAITKKMILIK